MIEFDIQANRRLTSADLIQYIKLASSEELYAQMHELQRKVCAPSFRNALGSLSVWKSAQSILDVGCSDGSFAREHRESLFAGKSYHGIDIDESLIHCAKNHIQGTEFNFAASDVYHFSGASSDVTFLLATLQSLPNTAEALDRLAKTTRLGFVILDTIPQENYGFATQPEIPSLKKHYDFVKENSSGFYQSPKAFEEARQWAASNGWSITVNHNFNIVVDTEAERQLQFYLSLFFEEVLEKKCGIPANFEQLSEDLEYWLSNDMAMLTTQGAGRLLVLERK